MFVSMAAALKVSQEAAEERPLSFLEAIFAECDVDQSGTINLQEAQDCTQSAIERDFEERWEFQEDGSPAALDMQAYKDFVRAGNAATAADRKAHRDAIIAWKESQETAAATA